MIVQWMPKGSLEVNAPGPTENEKSLKDTRHLSSFHVCQPCRDRITIHSELTTSTLNAGEFEVAIYPAKERAVRAALHHRWAITEGLQGEQDRLYYMTNNAYEDPRFYQVQCPPFTLHNMVSNLELDCCT